MLQLLPSPTAQAATTVSGTISQDTTWTTAGSPYVLSGEVTVAAGITLTIEPGVVVKGKYSYSGLVVDGTLNATNVIFTSYIDDSNGGDTNGDGGATLPAPGNWGNIRFNGGGGNLTGGCQLLYGGYSTAELYITNGSSPNIDGSTVSYSKTRGILLNGAGNSASITNSTVSNNQGSTAISSDTPFAALHDNRIIDNPDAEAIYVPANLGQNKVYNNTYSGNKQNAMFLNGADPVSENTDWPASNSPYVIGSNGNIDVQNNAVLTIDPGVVVKFWAYRSLNWNTLQVNSGSILSANNVVFTSYYDDANGDDTNGDGGNTLPQPGNWGAIVFNGGGGSITGGKILYGGGSTTFSGEIYIKNNGFPTITGAAISNSKLNGIFVASGSPSIHYNDIFTNANGHYGIYGSVAIDATNNWWGGVGGPKPYGTGNAVNNKVAVDPWSDVPFTQAGAEAQAMGTDTWCGAYGEPVNTSTGAFFYSHTDISIPTRGLPLEFARTYNSNDGNDGPLGYGWSFGWQASANLRANGDVIILRGDGRRDTFTLNPDSSFSPPPGRHDTLTRNPDGTYRLLLSDQTTYSFGANNRLASVVSETGQATTLTYDGNKRLVAITEPAGRVLTLTYTPENRIDEVTDPEGNTVSFTYSPEGDLIQTTDQNGGITAYTYDAAHRITAITDPNGSTFVNNTYDDAGKVAEQTDAEGNLITFAYDAASRKTTMTRRMDPGDPAKDQVTVHEYDSQLRLVKETDPYGKTTTYTYDAYGNRDSETDRRGVTIRTIYDERGNATDLYKAYGRPEEEHIHITYNARNRPLTKTNARGHTTSYTYDSSEILPLRIDYPQVTGYDGSLSSYFEAFTYNADATLATATDRNGDVTSYAYDSYGNPDSVTRNINRAAADQVTLDYDFDLLGRKTAFTDGGGHQTTFEYSPIGDLRFERTTLTNPETQLPEDVVTEFQYDGNGNKTAVIDPEGGATTYAYTPMDNLSLITDARLNTIEHTYDAAYNRTATRDRNGNWTNFGYDKNNRMVSATDPEGYATGYLLDEEGNQISTTDPLGRTTARSYDSLGRLTSVTEPDEGGATRTTTYTYDAAGNLISTTNPAGHTYLQAFDELSRLKTVTDPLSNSVSYRYDGQGNRTKMKDQRGYETSFTYSPNDVLTTVTDPTGGITAYAYDKDGNMTSQTDAEGRVTLYAYDELGRLTSEKVDAGSGNFLLQRSYAYDRAGNLMKDTTGEGTITYTYDDVYNMVGITDRQGATYSFGYDGNQNQLSATENATGRAVSFTYNPRGQLATSTGAHGANEAFTYDGTGNLVQRDDTVAGQNTTTTFSHTPRNQVKSVTRGSNTTSFTYDAAGNLNSKVYANGVSTTYSYDAASRPTALAAAKDSQALKSYSQSYDAAGNVTSLTEPAGTNGYSYDALNRLTSESIPAHGSIAYTYDKTGNRLTKTEPRSAGGPTLSLSQTRVYWASYNDYLNRQLSIDYKAANSGPGTAVEAKVTGATATRGVYLTTPVPLPIGDIPRATLPPLPLNTLFPWG